MERGRTNNISRNERQGSTHSGADPHKSSHVGSHGQRPCGSTSHCGSSGIVQDLTKGQFRFLLGFEHDGDAAGCFGRMM